MMRPDRFLELGQLALLVLVTLNVLIYPSDASAVEEVHEPAGSSSGALQNFNQFKILFHKSYDSITEELRRQAMFLGNLMQAFTSRLKFNKKLASSFRAVNEMSDWTEAEFKSTLLTPAQYYEAMRDQDDQDEQEDSSEANFRQVVERVVEQQMAETAGRGGSSSRRKRSIESVLEKLERLDDKIYTRTDLAVQRALRTLYHVKWAPYDPSEPDEIFTDHRGCLGAAKSQKRCPCCHVFATLGLYEWAYCNSRGNEETSRIEFSPQYVLDCGPEMGVHGWDGGSESQVAKFVKRFGFELGARYKFTSMQATCAYNVSAEHERKTAVGLLRLDKPKLARVTLDEFERQLRVSPLTVVIYTSSEFSQYGGGVDEGRGCRESRRALHAVLLVGSGRQDGHEYWLMRNSHGDTWGERGYYKVRKDSDCLADFGSGYTLKVLKVGGAAGQEEKLKRLPPPYEFSLNDDYDWRLLAKRYKKYVHGPPELPGPIVAGGDHLLGQ